MDIILCLLLVVYCVGDFIVYIKQKEKIKRLERDNQILKVQKECLEFIIKIDECVNTVKETTERLIKNSDVLVKDVHKSISNINDCK